MAAVAKINNALFAKIVGAFAAAGLLAGIVAFVYAATLTGVAGMGQDLTLILCPPSLGSTLIHSRVEGLFIWAMICIENSLLYFVLGLPVAFVAARLRERRLSKTRML